MAGASARAAVAADVAAATGGVGTVAAAGDYLSAAGAQQARTNRQASVVLLGMALLYTAIAIANTLVMATRDRSREFATVRLAGATRRQVVAVVAAEAVLVTGIGAALAAAVTGITAWGAQHGLAAVAPSVPIAVPWGRSARSPPPASRSRCWRACCRHRCCCARIRPDWPPPGSEMPARGRRNGRHLRAITWVMAPMGGAAGSAHGQAVRAALDPADPATRGRPPEVLVRETSGGDPLGRRGISTRWHHPVPARPRLLALATRPTTFRII